MILSLIFLSMIVCIWAFFPTRKPLPVSLKPVVIYPYKAFYQALETPTVSSQIKGLAAVIKGLYDLVGWGVSKIDYSNGMVTMTVNDQGGSASSLQAFADAHHCELNLNHMPVTLHLPLQLSHRPKPDVIYPSKAVIEAMIDRVDRLTQTQSVMLGARVKLQSAYKQSVSIAVDDAAPDFLDYMANELQGLPIVLNHVVLALHDGLLSGSIQLSVWGS